MAGKQIFDKGHIWVLDSGASHHMTPLHSLFENLRSINAPFYITVPTRDRVVVDRMGTITLNNNIKLHDVLYIPQFNCNLISVHKLTCGLNCIVTYFAHNCVIHDQTTRRMIGLGDSCDGIYILKSTTMGSSLVAVHEDATNLWHARMGHPSDQILSQLSIPLNFHFDKNKLECFDVCHRSKQCRLPFSLSNNKAETPFSLIHYDLWWKYHTMAHNGAHYFITIVDDYTRAVWVYLLKEKSKTPNILMNFCNMIQTQFSRKVKVVRSDNGTEFTNNVIHTFFQREGILHETSCVGTPQKNGRVERKHRHILNVTRALRFQSCLPISFWGEYVLAATHLIN
uniref:Retrovirus-related Pol polyprotein from transposon TNT 1-94 n=1 Tax=Cajanus cajan TaxID=3821 RepID=A0A151QT93_CAJCA|nr:Retrovirus-related Pol polyprotein from transposon TNT 1-94 [Cajanus cajan]